MNIDDVYQSRYLTAKDIETDKTLTIRSIEVEEIDGDRKAVLHFKETTATLPLNRTNAGSLRDAFGRDTNSWIGQQVTLFRTEVDFRGKRVNAVRIQTESAQEEIPF